MTNFEEKFRAEYGDIAHDVLSLPCHERLNRFVKLLGNDYVRVGEILALLVNVKFYEKFSIENAVLKQFPADLVMEYKILPLKIGKNEVTILACWPLNDDQTRWVKIALGKKVKYCLGQPKDILKFIEERFGLGVESSSNSPFAAAKPAVEAENSDAIVIHFVNELIKRCIRERATDIHFEPQRDSLMIRYRVDGDLIIAHVPDNLKNFQSAIISRLKIMARLNISEKRLPQDGKIMFQYEDDSIDIRVSTLPAIYGESVSLRLLNNSLTPKELENIFLNNEHKNILQRALTNPHGIILVTGPTGSGKSTTLSACLRAIRAPEKRLMTVEDPIEYEVGGINQTQVNPAIGLTFGNILRSILRQDPDTIMIGEIRDRETADIAIRASITGHLVLSTLHTNDAIGAIIRLRDIGIEQFLLASAVKLVLAQRLVRKLCDHCAVSEDFSQLPRSEVEHIFGTNDFGQARRAVGCEYCNNTGFFGRVGVFEFLEINDDVHAAIAAGLPESEIRSIAEHNHMCPLKLDALRNIRLGVTSITEALRVVEH